MIARLPACHPPRTHDPASGDHVTVPTGRASSSGSKIPTSSRDPGKGSGHGARRAHGLDGVLGGAAGVAAPGGGGPGVIARLVLLKFPACSLFLMVVMAAAGATVTGAGQATVFERGGVLVVAAGGVALAGRPRAGAVPDFDEVAEFIAGVVGGGLVPVIAGADRDGCQVNRQFRQACLAGPAGPSQPAGLQPPGPVSAGGTSAAGWLVAGRGWPGAPGSFAFRGLFGRSRGRGGGRRGR